MPAPTPPPLPLVLDFELTQDDVTALHRWTLRGSMLSPWRVVPAVALVALFVLLGGGRAWESWAPFLALTLLFAAVSLWLHFGAPKRAFARLLPEQRRQRVILEAERLSIATSVSDGWMAWSTIPRVIARADALFIQRHAGLYNILPERAFPDPASFAATSAWLVGLRPAVKTQSRFLRTLVLWAVLLVLFFVLFNFLGSHR